MPSMSCTSRHAGRFFMGVLLLSAGALGCGQGSGVGKTYPVSGLLTLDGKPFTAETTMILFKPEAGRGNTSTFSAAGTVDGEGRYELTTGGKKGAPLGWYKVLVTAHGGSAQHPTQPAKAGESHPQRPVAQSLLPAKYGLEGTSDLLVEVVESPVDGAYDLRLHRN